MGILTIGLLIVGLSVTLAVTGMILVRRRVSLSDLISHHDVADPLLSVIGTFYAVLLGFLVVDATNKFQVARSTVEAEANSVADVFMLAAALPDPHRYMIQSNCIAYVKSVVDDEWNEMEHGKQSWQTLNAMHHLWKSILSVEPKNDRDSSIFAQLLSEQAQLSDNRRTRLVTAQTKMPSILWIVLFCGAVSTIVFTYFFGLRNMRSQIVMTVLLALTISLNIFLLVVYNSPFSGDLKIGPDAFRLDAKMFEKHFQHPEM